MSKKKSVKNQPNSEEFEQQIAELTADIKRVQADFVNYKRRSEEDSMRKQQSAKRLMIAALLPTIDNLERALGSVPEHLTNDEWAIGVKKTADNLIDSLNKLGVEKIKTVGEEFDPEYMDAVAMEDGEGDKEIVTEEIQSGYKIGDDILRHAMVKVKRQR